MLDPDSRIALGAAPAELRAHSRELLAQVGAGGEGRDAAREALVHLHRPLVEHCARRFADRGEPHEDLVQVGMIGLLNAIDRFDPGRGLEFTSFATPTILGEVRRWFRDKGWAVRVPRRLQELRARITATSADLAQELGRSPTAAELAAALGCSVAEVVDGLESAAAYATVPLDTGAHGPDDPLGPSARLTAIGTEDEALAHIEARESVRPLLERLAPRAKRILLLRFYGGLTQSQIAADVGLSQMQVSRLLSGVLGDLRAALEPPPSPPGPVGQDPRASRSTEAGCTTPSTATTAVTTNAPVSSRGSS